MALLTLKFKMADQNDHRACMEEAVLFRRAEHDNCKGPDSVDGARMLAAGWATGCLVVG